MAARFDTNTVINGTWGTVKINDEIVAEAIGLEAKLSVEKEEVKQTGTLAKGYKITGTDGKGTIKLNKVNSRMINLMSANLQQGKSTVATIESELADPASGEGKMEKVVLKGCIFDELTLADWEAKKIGEESVAFTFTEFDVQKTIDPPKTGA